MPARQVGAWVDRQAQGAAEAGSWARGGREGAWSVDPARLAVVKLGGGKGEEGGRQHRGGGKELAHTSQEESPC